MNERKADASKAPPEIVIFKKQTDGSIHWVEPARDVESAKARVQELGAAFPGEYLIVNQETGSQITIIVPPNSDRSS